MCSHRRMISRRSWSTTSMPQPRSPRMASIASRSASDSASLMPAAGSSSSRKRGEAAGARAISSRRWSPYESVPAERSSSSASPSRSSTDRAYSRDRRRFTLPAATALTWTFWSTVRPSNRRTFWNVRTTPRRARSCAGRPPIGRPSSQISPELAGKTPETQFRKVVLPDPFGPIRPTTAPSRMHSVTPRNAWTPAKFLVTPTASSTPLPPTEASLHRGCEFSKVVVAEQAALIRPQPLHRLEQRSLPVRVDVEAELGALDPDRVEAALLAEHDLALGADQVGGERLDRGRVVELACDGAALAHEQVLAYERLPRLELVAGQRADARRDLAQAVEAEIGADAVEGAQRERHLAEVRVPGALAHAVDRPVDPARAGAGGGDGGGRAEPEVVVPVEVERHVRAEPLARLADQEGDCLGSGDADRVDHHRLLRARLDRGLVDGPEVAEVGARPVDAEERDGDPLPGGVGDGVDDPLQHRLAIDTERLQLAVADRRLDHARLQAELEERIDVGPDRAREAPDLGVEARVEDQAHGALVLGRDARKARLDTLDPEPVELPGDVELLLGVEHDADRLLAVAEGGVVEADLGLERRAAIDVAGPDLPGVGHRHESVTTPSGNGESFSAPVAVTRKLSSSRSPPPSSQ